MNTNTQITTGANASGQPSTQPSAQPFTPAPPPPPPGFVPDQKAQSSPAIPPPPPGFVPDSSTTPPQSDELQINPNDSLLTKAWKVPVGVMEGGGEGIFGTAAGVSDIIDKATGMQPGSVSRELHTLAGDNDAQHGMPQQFGRYGESIAEFILGDEALKSLALSDRLATAVKAQKLMEESPVLNRIFRTGVAALRGGAVQGAQTYANTGGNLRQAGKDAAIVGGTAGLLGGVTGTLSDLVSGAAKKAISAQNLAEMAQQATDRASTAESLADKIDEAKKALHLKFEAGIADLNNRLGDTSIPAIDNPITEQAHELLGGANAGDHPLVTQAKQATGEQLAPPVRNLLMSIANGTDVAGRPLPDMTADDLIQLRQGIRKLADSYDYDDVNARMLKTLLGSVDDAIGKLAEKSGDQTAVSDYQALRNDYRTKIQAFENPVMRNLRAGKHDDASRAFLSGNQTRLNTQNLRTILGDEGVKEFGDHVVNTILSDSMNEAGQVNPGKFLQRLSNASKKNPDLFGLANPESGFSRAMADAANAAKLQKTAKFMGGAAVGTGLASMPAGHLLGTALGILYAEGHGAGVGPLLDYITANPKVLNAAVKADKLFNSPAMKTASTAARTAIGKGIAAQVHTGANSSEVSNGNNQGQVILPNDGQVTTQ